MLSLLRAWVQSLVRELRFCKPCGVAKFKRERDVKNSLRADWGHYNRATSPVFTCLVLQVELASGPHRLHRLLGWLTLTWGTCCPRLKLPTDCSVSPTRLGAQELRVHPPPTPWYPSLQGPTAMVPSPSDPSETGAVAAPMVTTLVVRMASHTWSFRTYPSN